MRLTLVTGQCIICSKVVVEPKFHYVDKLGKIIIFYAVALKYRWNSFQQRESIHLFVCVLASIETVAYISALVPNPKLEY